jgi:hypothetical protein
VEPSAHTIGAASRRRRARGLAAALLGLALVLRAAAVFTTNIHWDEFGLLHLADVTEATGRLEAGGRPGLAVVLLLPFVRDCDDETQVVRRARLLWAGITLLWLAGVWFWIAQLAPRARSPGRNAALGLGLLALTPAFLDASLQVRTDQLALAGGAWGGALLLASRRRPALALLAGALLGLGFLGSQKLLYVGALAGLLAAGQLLLTREWRPARELLRGGLSLVGVAVVVAGFQVWADLAFEVPEVSRVRQPLDRSYVAHGVSLFEFYRNTIGWSQYREMLPELVPHALLLAGLAAASLLALRRPRSDATPLLLAWAVLGLGLAVALFHAAAFRYFWLTLGLFPAVAFALARSDLEALAPARLRRQLVAGFWLLLLIPGALHLIQQLWDGQAVQRESLAFVHRNFDRRAAGFHPESGLFCQEGVQPLPTFFSQHIHHRFAGPNRERHTRNLIDRFRQTPVQFLVQSFRLNQFPVEVRRFWSENYQPYRASVFVAGRRLHGSKGERADFELVVPGRYRWLPFRDAQPLGIEDRLVAPGEIVTLGSGAHSARFIEDVPDGLLVLALDEAPGPAPRPFYR